MATSRYLILAALLGLAVATSASTAVKPVPHMQSMIDEEASKCKSGTDSMACIKERAMRFLDTVINKDSFKVSDVEVHANGYRAPVSAAARSNSNAGDFIDTIDNYIQGHDITIDLPVADAKVTVSSRNLANGELNLNVKLDGEGEGEGVGVVEGKGKKGNIFKKGKKHRLRKMAMPIMVLILLKAITVIPMAIGILKIKAFNALALGFFSFIVSVGLAIFQLCKKIAAEHHHHSAHITAHGPWDGRSIGAFGVLEQPIHPIGSAQNLAYNAYA